MTTKLSIALLIAFASVHAGIAQEPSAPAPTPTPDVSPAAVAQESPAPTLSPTPEGSPSVSPTPEQSPSPSAAPSRSVRISFLPPPLEGTISLGIYDEKGTLVRVLHQQAELSEFTIGADALVTEWDGKDDDDEDLPAGKYHAHGYLVGEFKVEDVAEATPPPVESERPTSVKVRLMPNPLANNKRPIIDLVVGFDSDGSYLKTIDDLPLFMLSETPNLVRAFIAKKGEKSVDVWLDDSTSVRQFRISNVDKMMAFDCGEFELK
jgi:hypothetical protein